ncbi:MAG: RidA family protein [Clostridiales bacterium]|nr:RidA family protein [Clostridiales bacterium]
MSIEKKLSEIGVELPTAASPVGAYVPAVRSGKHIFTSGQVPLVNGEIKYAGKVGVDVSEEDAYQAAKICVINCLAAIKGLTGSLDGIKQIVKVTGFVNSAPDFTAHAKVVNGASEFLGQLFETGHARAAVGVAALPLNAVVEVEMIVEVE